MMGGLILIIDDEETLTYFLKESLCEEYEVLLAPTGRRGLEEFENNPVDLVLLDLKLPDLDGLDILRYMRAGGSDIPVIVLTGHAEVASAVEAMRLGAYDYLEKPLDVKALKGRIARALERPPLPARVEIEEVVASEVVKARPRSDRERVVELEMHRRRLERRVEDLERLEALSASLGGAEELSPVVEAGLAAVTAVEGVRGAAIFVLVDGLYILTGQRLLPWEAFEEPASRRIPIEGGVAEVVASRGKPVALEEGAQEPWFQTLASHFPEARHSTLVPLRWGDRSYGLIFVVNRSNHPFGPREMELLASVGERIGLALKRVLEEEALRSRVKGLLEIESAFQSMKEGLLVADIEGRITLANRAAGEILGYENLEGKGIGEVLGDEEAVVREGIERGIVVMRREVEVKRGDGGVVLLGMSVSPLRGEEREIRGVVIVISDISEAREIEEERRRLDRLALLGEMSAIVAHEIRNPLAGIGAGVQHLAEKVGREDALYEGIEMIMRESERVNRIIEDILMISRPVRLHLAPCNIAKVTEEIVDTLQEKAKAHGVEVVTYFSSDLPPIRGDAFRLGRALSEIVAHRIEALADGGELRVMVTSERGYVEVEVRDSGIGIREEDRGKVFEPFWSRKPGGTGLGLAIAKRIIEEHGGEIGVESKEGEGSVFRVRVPVEGR
jgi:PAS domain S-box-containing protein